ncbi:hypothetical protein [Sporichthya brevicatena]
MRAFTRGLFRQPPSDTETAHAMRALAGVFLHSTAAEFRFGWDGADVDHLDALCDRLVLPGQRAVTTRSAVAARMGAFVGELLVRNAGGRWVYDEACRTAAVELPNGQRVHPTERVSRRITVGHHHSIAEFYRAAVAGDSLVFAPRQAG